MKELSIVFTRSKKKFAIGSYLIRWWTKKPYSHVAREGKIGFCEHHHYFQASEGQVNYEYESHFSKKHEIVKKYTILVPKEIYYSMIKESWKQAGASYGTMQNLGILIVDLLNKIGIKATNPFKSGINCSELIYRTVLQKMIPNLPYRADLIKPHQIEEIIIENELNIK